MTDETLFAARYRILRTIGSGGMGEVCLVEDTQRGNKIMALKTMKELEDPAVAEGFRSEFRNVHGVVHPNIPEVYDFGLLPPPGQRLFFTCEFVDGQPLDRLSASWMPLQLHVILVSLCRALSFLHSRGLLHRDIKPQNILGRLSESGDIHLLKLVDFGLSSFAGQDAATAGTVEYMAPELIEGGQATVASDIYAAGMLLYRMATGRLPFEGDDPLAMARQRCTTEAPSPLRFRPDLPVGLADVISALIRVKPEERPASARRVIALLNEREGTDYPYETPETRSAYIHSAAFVINGEARAALERLRDRMRRGETPPPVVIESRRGLGCHRLIRNFVSDLTVEGISAQVLEDGEPDAALDTSRVLCVPHAPAWRPEALRELLTRARERGRWCIVGVPPEQNALTGFLDGAETLRLRPLEPNGVSAIIAAIFPENSFDSAFADRLYDRTLGFAAAIQDALDRLLTADLLRIGLSGWELLPGSWDFPVHEAVQQHIAQTMAALPPAACELVRALACSSVPLPAELLGEILPEPHAAGTALRALSAIAWLTQSPEGFALRFPTIGTCVTGTLTAETRQTIHESLRRVWLRAPAGHPRRARELLFHDVHARSWQTHAIEAATLLRAALENGDGRWVRRLIEFALACDPPPALRGVLEDALVAVEYTEGNIEAAAELLGRLLHYGQVDVTDANLEGAARYAMLEEKLGRTEHAEELLERCLAALPSGHDHRAGTVFGTLAWIAFKRGEADKARRLAEEGLVRVPPQVPDAGHALLLNNVATAAFYRGDGDAAALYWNRCLEVYEAIRDRKGIANIYNNLGVLAAQSGDRLRARDLWQQCARLAQEIGDVHRLAGIYNNLGIDALETGQLAEAEEYYLKALALFRRMKHPREQVETLSNLGELAYFRADFSRAQAYLQEAINLAGVQEDLEGEVEPLVYMGKLLLTLEQIDRAQTVLERACRTAHDVEVKKGEGQAWEALAMLHARQGDPEAAVLALGHARKLLSEEMDPLALLHLHLTECLVAAEQQDTAGVRDALTQARKVADIKWDPFTAARTLVYGLLFAEEEVDPRERPRVLRQLTVYPDFLWRFHWAAARRLAHEGAVRKALDEYGRGVAVLKAIAARLPEESRNRYLGSPPIRQFKNEALAVRNSLKES